MTTVILNPGGDEPDLVGKTLGHFKIVDKLGAGGMGVVYRGLDTKLKREVALKFLPHDLAGNEEVLSRFEREAEAVAALNHPNIITIHSVEDFDDHHFIVMELVEGSSFDRLIGAEGMPPDRFVEVAIALSEALAAAHERGIVHRDLKPGNIMETQSGLIKVLDFGLAKLFQPAGAEDETQPAADLTRAGAILGTPAYMSPEQITGRAIDHRTDIFSLGIIFYEMVSGQRPFPGDSPAEIVSGILRDRPTSMTELRGTIPGSLSRIVERCMEKAPESRFQTARELHDELTGLKRALDSNELMATARALPPQFGAALSVDATQVNAPPIVVPDQSGAGPDDGLIGRLRGRRVAWSGAALLVLAIVIALYVATTRGGSEDVAAPAAQPPAVAAELKPSLALLHFRNLAGDADLEWLQAGLPEMLSTSLSQAPGVKILSTDRVYEILRELDGLDKPMPGHAKEFAARGEVVNVLSGTFARLGDSFRIAIKVEDATTGEELINEQVEGVGESSLFGMIDRLSERVLVQLDVSGERGAAPEDIMQVMTASVEAYRYYTEAIRLRRETKRDEALLLLDRAVELDPGFAMALSKMSTEYLNKGDDERAREYARRAFENSAQAPARERYYIQGMYLGLEWGTYLEAIGALGRAVEDYPDHDAARRNLAFYLVELERFEEAIPHYRKLVSERPAYGGNYYLLAESYDALDRFEEGQKVSLDYLQRSSGNWYSYLINGFHLLRWGKPEEALETMQDAEEQRPGTLEVVEAQWAAYIQLDRWREAEAVAASLAATSDPYYRWLGNVYVSRSALYRGETERAIGAIHEAAAGFTQPGAQPGMAHVWAADLLLLLGEDAAALDAATEAQRMGRGQWAQLNGQFLAGLALERLGRSDEADVIAADLQRRVDTLPNNVERRQALHLAALLDRSRGDLDGAIDKLTRAVALLPPRGLTGPRRIPDHAPLWFSLAEALQEAGRDSEAASWFERVVENRVEARNYPVRWARALYHLGEIHQRSGEADVARGYFERFVEQWGSGDADRERIAHARTML